MCAARGSESWCNLRSSVEELDVVTEDGPVLVCVEVKAVSYTHLTLPTKLL
jgi:Holliday junction resolvase-like predicted endonuclease